MPIKKGYGGRLDPGSVGGMKVPTNPAPKSASAPLQLDRFWRNGRHPDANAANMVAEAATQSALYRGKQIFNGASRMDTAGIISSFGAGDRARWRFAFHLSPYAHCLYFHAVIAAPTTSYTSNTHARIDIFSDTAETTVVSTRDLIYGASPIGSSTAEGFPYLREVTGYLDGLTVDTDYYGAVYDVDGGRILSLMVCEMNSFTENNAGYPAMNLSVMSPVVDATRENIASIVRNVWTKGASTVFTWSRNDGTSPVTITGTTPVNLLDTAVTAVSAASPGWTVDLSNHDRLSQASTGVPVVIKIFGAWVQNASPNASGGDVLLKDSGGTTIASVTNGWSSATPAWVTISDYLPASSGKYDVMINSDASGSGSLSVYAISVYEKD
jgi:hypothetical protein